MGKLWASVNIFGINTCIFRPFLVTWFKKMVYYAGVKVSQLTKLDSKNKLLFSFSTHIIWVLKIFLWCWLKSLWPGVPKISLCRKKKKHYCSSDDQKGVKNRWIRTWGDWCLTNETFKSPHIFQSSWKRKINYKIQGFSLSVGLSTAPGGIPSWKK